MDEKNLVPFCEDSSIYLDDIYWNLNAADIPEEELKLIDETHKSNSTHGNTMFEIIREIITRCNITQDDIFLDLGCSVGMPCMQIAMETNVKESRGVELSLSRVKKAKKVLKYMRGKGLKTKVNFIHDTFLNPDVWKGATIVYSWVTLYPQRLGDIAKIAKDCETLRFIILRGATFESVGVDLKAHNLKREENTSYGDHLPIYSRVKSNTKQSNRNLNTSIKIMSFK